VLPEAGEAERWLAAAATDSRDGFAGDLADADRSYRASPVGIELRLESVPGAGGAEPPLECLLTPVEPAWQKATDGEVRTHRQYTVPAAAWARLRSYFTGFIIRGQLVARDGSVPVVGRSCAPRIPTWLRTTDWAAGPLRLRLVLRRLWPGGVLPHAPRADPG
jgi:hypothetical protein